MSMSQHLKTMKKKMMRMNAEHYQHYQNQLNGVLVIGYAWQIATSVHDVFFRAHAGLQHLRRIRQP